MWLILTHLRVQWAHALRKLSCMHKHTDWLRHWSHLGKWVSFLLLLLLWHHPPSSRFHSPSPAGYFLHVIYCPALHITHLETLCVSGWCANDCTLTRPLTLDACCAFMTAGFIYLFWKMTSLFSYLAECNIYWQCCCVTLVQVLTALLRTLPVCSLSRPIHHITFSSSPFIWKCQVAAGYDYWFTNHNVT